MIDFLTKEMFFSSASKIGGPYWKHTKALRWEYFDYAIGVARSLNPKSIVECGCAGVPLSIGGDVIDNEPINKPTILMDLTKVPWEIETGKYDMFMALQVWEHLGNNQSECFSEAIRISKNVLLSFPYQWKGRDAIHSGINDEVISRWTNNFPIISQEVIRGRKVCLFSSVQRDVK